MDGRTRRWTGTGEGTTGSADTEDRARKPGGHHQHALPTTGPSAATVDVRDTGDEGNMPVAQGTATAASNAPKAGLILPRATGKHSRTGAQTSARPDAKETEGLEVQGDCRSDGEPVDARYAAQRLR